MALKKKESMLPHPSLVGMSYFPITHQTSPRRCGIPEAELYFRGYPTALSIAVSVDAADDDDDADDVVVCTLKSEYFFVLRLFKIATPCRTESAAGRIFIL